MQHPTDVDRDPAALWMQKLASVPISTSLLPNPEVLWWQARALRQLDERRRLAAKLEIGERIQTTCVIAAALALLAWMFSQLSEVLQLPAYMLASVACAVLLMVVAVLMLIREHGSP